MKYYLPISIFSFASVENHWTWTRNIKELQVQTHIWLNICEFTLLVWWYLIFFVDNYQNKLWHCRYSLLHKHMLFATEVCPLIISSIYNKLLSVSCSLFAASECYTSITIDDYYYACSYYISHQDVNRLFIRIIVKLWIH